MKKILIMGLPGSGKTTLASKLVPLLKAKWVNNDEVRKAAKDWDFSDEGRKRRYGKNSGSGGRRQSRRTEAAAQSSPKSIQSPGHRGIAPFGRNGHG